MKNKGQQHTIQTQKDWARGTRLKHGGELRWPGKGRGRGLMKNKGQQHTIQTQKDWGRGTPLKHGGELRWPGRGGRGRYSVHNPHMVPSVLVNMYYYFADLVTKSRWLLYWRVTRNFVCSSYSSWDNCISIRGEVRILFLKILYLVLIYILELLGLLLFWNSTYQLNIHKPEQ